MKLVEAMPDAVGNMMSLVEGMAKAKDKDERKLCYEASKEVRKVAGILANPTQSTLVQQVHNQQNNSFLSPVIQESIKEHNDRMRFDKQGLDGEKDKEGNGDG